MIAGIADEGGQGFDFYIGVEPILTVQLHPGHRPFVTLGWEGSADSQAFQNFLDQMPTQWLGQLQSVIPGRTDLTIELEQLQTPETQEALVTLMKESADSGLLMGRAPQVVAQLAVMMKLIAPEIPVDPDRVFVADSIDRILRLTGSTMARIRMRAEVVPDRLSEELKAKLAEFKSTVLKQTGHPPGPGEAANYLLSFLILRTPHSYFAYFRSSGLSPTISINQVDRRVIEQHPELVESVIEPLMDPKPQL